MIIARIGVCGPKEGGLAAWWATAFAIVRSGGRPVRITPDSSVDLESLDGIVLGGGADVGEPGEPLVAVPQDPSVPAPTRLLIAPFLLALRHLSRRRDGRRLDLARDRLETELCRRSLEAGRPILGICRGAQLLNLVGGGTLHRDLATFYVERPNPRTVLPRKTVTLAPDSFLHEALGVATCTVNSLHDHAIDRVADAMRVAAWEDVGVVQAIEARAAGFVIGVQWHPEYLPQRSEQRQLFRRFVRAAVDYRQQREGTWRGFGSRDATHPIPTA